MDNTGYTLKYLPLFFDDVNNVTSYITNDLSNPKAAHDLLDAIETRRLLYNRQKWKNII